MANEKRDAQIQRILDRLWFRAMDGRHGTVKAAHGKTFKCSRDIGNLLSLWKGGLREVETHDGMDLCPVTDRSTFYANGLIIGFTSMEASSFGTLQGSKCHLTQIFAGSGPDDYAGAQEQRSSKGVWRPLLVLSKDPSLIGLLLPGLWKGVISPNGYTEIFPVSLPAPAEVDAAFQRLSLLSKTHEFCLFIQGFDEFDGDHTEGVSFLKTLAVNENILLKATLKEASETFSPLIEKASGVFLWVVLASKSVIEGPTSCDRLSDLQARIDELPHELEDFSEHILGSIPPRYQQQAALTHLHIVPPHAKPPFDDETGFRVGAADFLTVMESEHIAQSTQAAVILTYLGAFHQPYCQTLLHSSVDRRHSPSC
ncbi:hypothetical protein F4778DRAFT_788487 [Xylariomycetidae sp. FL2044]|nr:hypothetical protein F4778DRAFT_801341 [Xylariomycetidae sp. FL2044]KAH9883562.1 hypothetical protein F4778DRAFT_788487 [Xylariomycetidae sp. FL2044]